MARTGPQKYPGAVLDLFFGNGRYSGSDMEVNCGCIHTTEGPTLYDYNDGASAPTITSVPDFKNKRLVHHQHFDIDESARALVNKPGGVQTNTANVFQWELVGTCDPATSKKWTAQGIQHIYWPNPPDWAIREVAAVMQWLHKNHGVPLTGRPEWRAYPASYGATSVRMSFAEWTKFTGWCGHQHVPENDHGDPGALPFARILAVAKGQTTPTPAPQEDDVALTDAEIRKVATAAAEAVWAKALSSPTAEPGTNPLRQAGTFLRWGDQHTADILAKLDELSAQVAALEARLTD